MCKVGRIATRRIVTSALKGCGARALLQETMIHLDNPKTSLNSPQVLIFSRTLGNSTMACASPESQCPGLQERLFCLPYKLLCMSALLSAPEQQSKEPHARGSGAHVRLQFHAGTGKLPPLNG